MLTYRFARNSALVVAALIPITAYAQSAPNIPPGPGVVPGTTDPVPSDAHIDNSTQAEASRALTQAGYTDLKMLQKGYNSVWKLPGDQSRR